MSIAKTLILLVLISITTACSSFGIDEEAFNIPESELYEDAMEALKKEDYRVAADKFEDLESHYPFGRYSEQSQLELIFAYYKMNKYDAARTAADRFIRLHPQHDSIDYAYYLRGLTYFDRDKGLTERFLPTESSMRDPGAARNSFADFSTLLTRYPSSQYAPDARDRMLYLKNLLAAYEIHVARYYIKRGAHIAAANRGRYVVENYQETPAIPDALLIMEGAYLELGLNDLAANSRTIMDANFPNYEADKARREREASLLNKASFGLFGSRDNEQPEQDSAARNREAAPIDTTVDPSKQHSWFDRVTFGLFES
jgi:outer membrane protein assembly factor BamD